MEAQDNCKYDFIIHLPTPKIKICEKKWVYN